MNKICTSIEQSKKLIELGLDVNIADMAWNVFVDSSTRLLPINDWQSTEDGNVKIVPAWSLSVLLKLIMPKSTTPVYVDNAYQMVYDIKPYYTTSKFDNPLDAAFEMVCWLLENEKI